MAEEIRILVVDDDEMIRTLVARVLVREGFVVQTARDGVEAVAMLEAGGFDGIVLDLMMPSISGFRVLEILQQDPSLAPRWKVVMTAAVGKSLESLDGASVDCIVQKPFDIHELTDRVMECSRRARDTSSGQT